MTNKRFENRLDKTNIKFKTLNPVWDNKKGVALNVFEMIEEMNELENEKNHFKNGRSNWKITASEEICKHGETVKKLAKIKEKNEKLEQELQEFKDYVFSDEEILCYSCVNCVSKGIYEVECSEKGKVDVHSSCFSYWKNEVIE